MTYARINRDQSYTAGEEIANAVTHGLGALLSIAGLAVMVVLAALRGNALHVVSFAVFGTTLILLYVASTLYHSLTHPPAKKVFRILDHSAIYLLIAGTYTPMTLVALRGRLGWAIFGMIWGLAVVGIVIKSVFVGRFHKISVAVYLGMGWLCVFAFKSILNRVPGSSLILLGLGGLCYTVGVVFYSWRKLPYHHAVWHLFVLAGSALHFFAVLRIL